MTGWTGIDPAKWAQDQQDNLLRVFQQACILLARELTRTRDDGGTVPKVTGNLFRSLLAQIGSQVSISDATDFAGTDVGATVAQAILGDTVYLGYQANYARRQNYGFVGADALGRVYNQTGANFVERAVLMWPQLVDQAVKDVRGA
jgi:hypothetical protein